MDVKKLTKFTMMINTVILLMVLGLMLFFYLCKATLLVYFSIPTFFVYLFGYILIWKKSLHFYVCMVYFWLTVYMGLTTVCMGYEYGFHLYSLSMIPIIHYTNYMAYQVKMRAMKTGIFCAAIIACYIASTAYVAMNGPVYQGPVGAAMVFWFTNSAIVFYFLISYTGMMIKSIIRSEEKLKEMSYADRLTGLYNRHYMMEQMSQFGDYKESDTFAMIDIDDFKKINDIYGHNAGDLVLKKLADIMRDNCENAVISRWGGEEFLLLLTDTENSREEMEKLRRCVESAEFVYEDKKIDVSVTVGLARKGGNDSVDRWIQEADEKLYEGKHGGKNVVNG